LSASVLLDEADPRNPVNRRISIVVLHKDVEQSLLRGDELQVEDADALQRGLTAGESGRVAAPPTVAVTPSVAPKPAASGAPVPGASTSTSAVPASTASASVATTAPVGPAAE